MPQVNSHLLSSEAPAPSSPMGSTVTIVSTNQTVVGDPDNGTLVSNQTSAGQVINSTTQVLTQFNKPPLAFDACLTSLTGRHQCVLISLPPVLHEQLTVPTLQCSTWALTPFGGLHRAHEN